MFPIKSINEIVERMQDILVQTKEVPRFYDSACESYRQACMAIPGQIENGQMKIAVVGVIKSGKSTLVNSLLKKDLVKRGAGVITSITTRIQKGPKNQAIIHFKSWDQINTQLENALRHFPDHKRTIQPETGFDLRRGDDRAFLEQAYQKMCDELPASKELIQPETLMIRHALQGFDTCQNLVQADESTLTFIGKQFERHTKFTASADKAFFVKDVCLTIYGRALDPDLEVADCQGADATDPASLGQVLDYIEQAHLIIYCVSSRNGLRQADVTFINQIKKLGLIDHVLFINNCDLTEHENLEDLKKIEAGIMQDLNYLVNDPRIYSFSCLHHLFENKASRLSKKDKSRFLLWEEDKKMVQFCHEQATRFRSFFDRVIAISRQKYLAANFLYRLDLILSKLQQRSDLFLELLSSDPGGNQDARDAVTQLHLNASRLESIVNNSIEGAVSGLKDEICVNLDTAFTNDDMALLKKTRQHIDQINIDVHAYKKGSDDHGFNYLFYLMFQDFRRGLEHYELEQIKPKIKQFINGQELEIASHFQSLLNSYQIDLIKSGVHDEFEKLNMAIKKETSFEIVDINRIKQILGLKLPDYIFNAEYNSKTKAGIITDFGLSTLTALIGSLVNKRARFSFTPGLEKTSMKMRQQTKRQLKPQFEQYRQMVSKHYFTPLIDAATREFKQIIAKRFTDYKEFEEQISQMLDLEESQKQEQKEKISRIQNQLDKTRQSLVSLHQDLETMMDNSADSVRG